MGRSLGVVLVLSGVCSSWAAEKRVVPVSPDVRQSFERQPKVAVLAGVGQYPLLSGLAKLRYPPHDVDLVGAELEKQGYKVVVLKDQEGTRGSIEQALKNAAELVDPGKGTVVFFFSGHGFADGGENYLATFEATAGNLSSSGLAVKRVEELLKATGAQRQVMFIDACRNEPGKTVGSRTFDRFQSAAGLRQLLSTKAGRISYENEELGSGVFTHYLVRGLRGEAAGRDGLITFRDLADYVIDGVSTFGFKTGQMQVPYEAGESSGDFLLAPAAQVPEPSASAAPAQPPVAASEPVKPPAGGAVPVPSPRPSSTQPTAGIPPNGPGVAGAVVGRDGRPVTNAVVLVFGLTDGDESRGQTDANGNFRLEGLKAGLYQAMVDAGGVLYALHHSIEVVDGRSDPVRLDLGQATTRRRQ